MPSAPEIGERSAARLSERVSDGMPLRSELSFPGGTSLRTEYDYPEAAPDISLPRCAAPRS